MNEFRKLGIIEPILKVIGEEGFEKPSEIQEKAIPQVINGKDVLAGSATGSGKTLAFGAGILQNTERGKGIQSLVLTPTRELAEQVSKALKKFSKYKPLNIVVIYGGVAINPQMNQLETADIVVGTPGRMLDHLQRKTIDLKNVTALVLDEADIMFDMGFIDDVEKIMSQCAKKRQTMLFSATITGYVDHIIKKHMNNPVKLTVDSYVDPSLLEQVYYDVPNNLKFSLLVHLLKHEREGLVMVFCNSRQNVDFVAKNLKTNGIDATAIHGGYSQAKRSQTMDKFHSQKAEVLVCTDVAARGLDIKDVSHVYNYDIPKDSKQYIHRIGRTARAGKKGKAVNILADRDHDNFSRVLREFDVDIEKTQMPKVERVLIKRMPSDNRTGGPRRGSHRQPRFGGGQRDRSPRRSDSGSRSPRRSDSRHSSGEGRRSSTERGPRRPAHKGPRRVTA